MAASIGILFVGQRSLCPLVHEDEAKKVRHPIANDQACLKRRPINQINQPSESEGDWDVDEQIIPPRQRRKHKANHSQNPAAHFSFPSHQSQSPSLSLGW